MKKIFIEPLSTYTIPTSIVNLDLPLLRNFAKKIGKDIIIYDLETTTFVNEPTFGITEVAMLTIPHKGGSLMMSCDLVNPENPIAPSASEVTGINEAMVSNQPTFKVWLDIFERAARETLAFGYNSTSFDGPGVTKESTRYGQEIIFSDTIDLRQCYVNQMRKTGNGRKGKLKDVLEIFEIHMDEGWHRAAFDVIGTAKLTEAMLEHYGITGVLGRPIHKIPTPTENINKIKPELTNDMKTIYNAVREKGYDCRRIARESGLKINTVTDAAWDLFNGGDLRLEEISEQAVQSFLKPHIKTCAERAWTTDELRGRYKPVLEEIRKLPSVPYIDYTQLKIALTNACLR